MAYGESNPGPEPMSDMHEDMGQSVDVTSLIPPGMEVKDGEVLEFRVRKEGDKVMAEYNYGEDEGKDSKPWEDKFREYMSPRTGGKEMDQEAM